MPNKEEFDYKNIAPRVIQRILEETNGRLNGDITSQKTLGILSIAEQREKLQKKSSSDTQS